ncbi:type IV pilus twitching motility protein PilT [Bifidobacterium adolescentis]|uniref:Twitching motility protein PilT n=1 Tax=Bifidobacterium adolescentis TaxID=1680 RepID=A0A1X2ZR18_BIFAD|nr:type IV pilus twitching motility protein PilT [Bifidobacterium adolescentis]OSG96816.1 twitching motility protein PilT [Bifidobacterium adolescentis]
MTIEQTWNNGGYLSGLKGVTIPNNTPSFNEDPRKGRHWSSDNAIQADDESLKGIFASLNSMPTVSQQDVQIPDPQPVSQSQPSEQSVAQQQTTQAIQQSQEAHVFPTTIDRQPVGTGSLQFDEDTDATQQNPAYEEHGPIQQIDNNPPSFVPGATPFAKRQADIAETAAQQMPPTITHIPQDAAFQRPQPQQQQMSQPQPQTRPFADFVVPETNDADEDAVPEERKIKAEQVEQTLRTEHPDADDEFVSAIRQLVELNASDLHLVINDPPMLRVDGKLRPAKGLSVWTKDHTYEAVKVMTNELEMERFKDDLELDISFAIGDLLRFRVNVYRDRMGVCAALRTIPTEIKTAQELGIDPRIADLALLPRGLVLVCGPTGSGKSTTLAAIVDKANAERADHIITIEDPIEFVHQHKRCVMSQREVGTDTKSFAEALKRALREDPDIIEVGELRDLETISTALTAVETGHLVFATLHTQDAGSTVDRLIDVYPENQQQQIRVQVASTLRAVIVQTLIPRATGHGRAPATEVMINTPAVSSLIRSGKAHQIRTVLQSGEKEGMHTLDQDLARLVNKGTITFEDALVKVQVREEFEKLCGARSSF